MALGASYYMVWGAIDGEADMGKALLQAVVPADTPGIETDGEWNTLGMRGTYSPVGDVQGVRVPKDATLGQPGRPSRSAWSEGFGLGYAAIYIGLAEASLAFAADYAKKRIVRPENVTVAMDPAVQRHIGEMATHLEAARLVLDRCAGRWDAADPLGRGLLAAKAKYLATEVGPPRDLEGHPGRGRAGRLQGLPGRACLPRSPHLDPHAADRRRCWRRSGSVPSASRKACSASATLAPGAHDHQGLALAVRRATACRRAGEAGNDSP